ncbi:MAG: hypothetical protein JXB29_08790 [Sedimentisphaerales bacterium]|nr:hypothetical protein [Sedimentisphaerales bacterium]
MNILKTLFLEKELKQVLAALRQAESEFERYGYSTIKKSIEQCILVSMRGRAKKVLEANKTTPTMLMYYFLANVLADYLGSGRYHVYRGVLDFNGKDLYQILNICLEKLEAEGFTFGDQSVKEFRSVVDGEIKGVG